MKKTKLGLWTSTSLVVGNTIGAGIFLAPAVLAAYGSISLFGWLISGLGAFFLARVFIKFNQLVPGVSGGPYTYSRIGLGNFAGFQVAWGYWISVWVTNSAIAIALVSYLGVFIPFLNGNPLASVLVGLVIIWLLVWLNSSGIRKAGIFQLVTTILKIAPLLAIGILGWIYVDWNNFSPFNSGLETDFKAITACTALTVFSYLGIECATIPAEEVENSERTITKSTLLGLVVILFIYLACTSAIMGLIPQADLIKSTAPFADAAQKMWGPIGKWVVAAGAVFSTLGALNGWILIQGQIPAIAAQDKLFPGIFRRKNKKGAPVAGLVISSVLVSVLMMMNYTKGLVGAFKFALLLASITALLSYLFSSVGLVVKLQVEGIKGRVFVKYLVISFLAFLFSLWAFIGAGQEVVYWGFVLVLLGVPVYAWIKIKYHND